MGDWPPYVAARLEQSRQAAIRAKREGVLLTRRPLRRGEDPRSYLGGLPHLREDLAWPVSAETGLPLSFIAQIDLRDVPRPSGVFFPAEGLLWFFADFSKGTFEGDRHTRVLFDPHPRTMAAEREAPANLPPLEPMGYDQYGWVKARHPRVFVEPKAGLSLDRFDTFYDFPYRRPSTWEDFLRLFVTPKQERQRLRPPGRSSALRAQWLRAPASDRRVRHERLEPERGHPLLDPKTGPGPRAI